MNDAAATQPKIHPTADLKRCSLGRRVIVAERVVMREVEVGDYTYFERGGEAIYATIGKFCAIAANVRINAVEHPVERLSIHKFTYRPNEYFKSLGVDQDFRERRRTKPVRVGHDVWIGHGAVILPGLTIGNGAVIGANAVVTKDVAPFSIVAGVPAKPLRVRFPAEIAARIERLAWWDKDDEWFAAAVPDMQKLGIADFLDKWEGR